MMIMGARGNIHGRNGQEGNALIIVLMMIAMLGVLTLTLATLSVNNLTGARRAQQAGVALNAADAGLAQAVEYLRSTGVRGLTCSPRCDGIEGRLLNPWGNEASPNTATDLGDVGASYEVWIETIAAYPANNPGLYRLHSKGMTGSPAGRSVTQDVMVAPQKFPLGVFGKSISGGGDAGVHYQSMFTTGCVYQREKIKFNGPDLLNNLPAASMHSSQIITNSNGSGVYCPDTKKPIHDGTAAGYCNPLYPADQDSRGGPLTDPATDPRCLGVAGAYPQTSKIIDDLDLFTKFNLTSPPLTGAQLDRLKTVAISQGNYWTDSSDWTNPNETNAVMYFDLLKNDPGGEVNLNDITAFGRDPGLTETDALCEPKSLVIIVDGGNVQINSNQKLAASLFLVGDDPYGNVRKANGGSSFIGTLYANNIDLTGTADLHMDECFKSNLSPSLFDVETSKYREVDR